MKRVHTVRRILGTAALLGAVLTGRAEATTIAISPASSTVAVAGTFSVDILATLVAGDVIGGATFDLAFDPSIIQGASFSVDPDAKMGIALTAGNDLSGGFTPGNLNFDFLSDVSLDSAALQTNEGLGFRLATVTFTGLSNGFSLLTLSAPGNAFFSDFDGNNVIPTQISNGDVCVGGVPGVPCVAAASAVPEPATFALVGAGLAALVVRRRRQVK